MQPHGQPRAAEAAGLLRVRKSDSSLGWRLKAAERYLDHRGMKLAAASRLEPRIAADAELPPSDSWILWPATSRGAALTRSTPRIHPGEAERWAPYYRRGACPSGGLQCHVFGAPVQERGGVQPRARRNREG